ncbi:unnamed protein product, partial [Meganyctiphanes norvegica]
AMDKHQVPVLVRLIGVFNLVIGVTQAISSITCYSCTDDPDWGIYDPDCAKYSYTGLSKTENDYDGCAIIIYADGYLWRGFSSGNDDGECVVWSRATECYCKGDYCNTGSYCSQCGYPRPTPASTTPAISLACYQCIDCSIVDSSTPVISDASYQSCVTTVVLNDVNVIRGGSYDHHPDGECAQDSEILSCWCSSNLCNNIEI